MYEFLFHLPWYVPVLLIVFGVGLFIWGNNRMRNAEKRTGIALILLAILMSLVSYLVETDSEQVDRRTREFVNAIIARDQNGIGAQLDQHAAAFSWDKQEIIRGAIYYAEETGLKGARIIGLTTNPEGPDYASFLTVWSQHAGGRMVLTDLNSQWKLEWTKLGKNWQIINIIPLQIGQSPREYVEKQFLDRPVPAGPRGR